MFLLTAIFTFIMYVYYLLICFLVCILIPRKGVDRVNKSYFILSWNPGSANIVSFCPFIIIRLLCWNLIALHGNSGDKLLTDHSICIPGCVDYPSKWEIISRLATLVLQFQSIIHTVVGITYLDIHRTTITEK